MSTSYARIMDDARQYPPTASDIGEGVNYSLTFKQVEDNATQP